MSGSAKAARSSQRRTERWLDRLQLALNLIHTGLMARRFARWGKNSRLEPFCKLIEPYLVEVGSDVHICSQTWLNAKDDRGDGTPTLRIGDRSYLGRMVQINAWQDVEIGEDVLIGDRVIILDADHLFDRADIGIRWQGEKFMGPVRIESGSWIAAGALIMPGVTIGRNAVVAANAVVTANVPARTVVGGVPARIIKTLD